MLTTELIALEREAESLRIQIENQKRYTKILRDGGGEPSDGFKNRMVCRASRLKEIEKIIREENEICLTELF